MVTLSRAAISVFLFASATGAEPLPDHDNGGIPGVFHFPDSTEGATLVQPGAYFVSLWANTSSHSSEESLGDEFVYLDGETTRLELNLRFGLSSRLEMGIDIPYLWHTGGALDSFIDTWHDTFGLPSGKRDGRTNDQMRFAFRDADGERFDKRRNSHGIGDLRLNAGWRLTDSPKSSMALRFGLTLPTGDSNLLHGSGGGSLSVGIAGDTRELSGHERLDSFYRVHLTHIGRPDLLADRYRKLIGQFSAGIAYRFLEHMEVVVQTAARSAVYDSDTKILGSSSVTITFGGNFRLSDRFILSLSVGEDIKVRSAPDVSFQLAFRYRPDS